MDEHTAINLLPSHTMSKSINFLFIFNSYWHSSTP